MAAAGVATASCIASGRHSVFWFLSGRSGKICINQEPITSDGLLVSIDECQWQNSFSRDYSKARDLFIFKFAQKDILFFRKNSDERS